MIHIVKKRHIEMKYNLQLQNRIRRVWETCADMLRLPILKELTWKEIHIGIKDNCTDMEQLLNHIIILIEFMIFWHRAKGEPPTAREIKDKLLESRNEERKLAVERDTVAIHFRKWEVLEELQ